MPKKVSILPVIEAELLKKLSQRSTNLYMNIIKKVKQELSPDKETMHFLYDAERVIAFLKEHYSIKSLRVYIGYLVGALKALEEVSPKKKQYKVALSEYKKQLKGTAAGKKSKVEEPVLVTEVSVEEVKQDS